MAYRQHNMDPVSTPYHNVPTASNPDLHNYQDSGIPSPSGNHALSSPNTPLTAGQHATTAMPTSRTYENIEAPPNNNWMERPPPSSSKKKWIIIGSVVVLAALIAIGVALGVTLSKKRSSSSSSNLAGGPNPNNPTSSSPNGTNPNDPSSFPKNSALKQSFYGLAYTPVGSQLPNCGNSLAQVIEDVQLMSQLTTQIRLYGADCNQSGLVLAAISLTKVNLSVYLGNYPVSNDNGTAYARQRDEIKAAIQTYGSDHVAGVTVGNEFILDYITEAGQTDPNGAAGNAAAAMLIGWIADTRSMLTSLNLPKTIAVGNSDAGSYFNNKVLAAVDYGLANVHPWFANQSIDNAAGWTADFFQTTNVALAQSLPNKPQMYIAETGWPTSSVSFNYSPDDGPSLASVANLQIYLDTFVCQANKNGTGYFFFEFCDMEWQAQQYGGVEGSWGLFDGNKKFKNLTIPICS